MTEEGTPGQDTPAVDPLQRRATSLARRWVLKTLIITIVALGFGVWGLIDALIVYPNRGERVASYHLWKYLESLDEPTYGITEVIASDTPVDDLRELREREESLRSDLNSSSNRLRKDAERDLYRLQWYEALAVIGRLNTERVTIENPGEKLNELDAEWVSDPTAPKPLASYDIPVQWVFVVVGFGGGIFGVFFFANVSRKKYAWDPDEMRLTLDDGNTLVPADVEVFDRRKWDKFLYFLRIKDGHPKLAGQEIKVDLYRYEPLEEWLVAMHKHEYPEDFEEEPADAEPESSEPESEEREASA